MEGNGKSWKIKKRSIMKSVVPLIYYKNTYFSNLYVSVHKKIQKSELRP